MLDGPLLFVEIRLSPRDPSVVRDKRGTLCLPGLLRVLLGGSLLPLMVTPT